MFRQPPGRGLNHRRSLGCQDALAWSVRRAGCRSGVVWPRWRSRQTVSENGVARRRFYPARTEAPVGNCPSAMPRAWSGLESRQPRPRRSSLGESRLESSAISAPPTNRECAKRRPSSRPRPQARALETGFHGYDVCDKPPGALLRALRRSWPSCADEGCDSFGERAGR